MARAFKKKFHITLKKFISWQRMEKARELLSQPGYSPAVVAELLGYSRVSSLFREYKRKWGHPPEI
jgi:AraC-like DNA-binding protein